MNNFYHRILFLCIWLDARQEEKCSKCFPLQSKKVKCCQFKRVFKGAAATKTVKNYSTEYKIKVYCDIILTVTTTMITNSWNISRVIK